VLPAQFRVILTSFLQRSGQAFSEALPEERIAAAFESEGVSFASGEDDIYTPAVTLWTFLSQVLFKDEQRSCFAAVSRVMVLMVALHKRPPANDTAAYCRARAKLPERVLRRLTCELANNCERDVPPAWLWHGRHVKLVDGTTVSMPDTKANQAEYPQHTAQQPGLGFPIARLVALLSFATGMLCDLAIGPYSGKETGETALLRELLSRLEPGDILLADRYYCSYFMICSLLHKQTDVVMRLHQLRKADFRRGERLAAGDHVVEWQRPVKPEWMTQDVYDQMPQSIKIREVEVAVAQPGFRVRSLVVVTTLLDAEEFTRDDIAQLYRGRWLAELDIRSIKITLNMDVLRCKTPAMVRREIWTCLLAYNLVRQSMLNTARLGSIPPRQLSFTAGMQQIAAGLTVVVLFDDATFAVWLNQQQQALLQRRVGDRPNRIEPRAIKRRPKPHKLLTKPRDVARADLLAGKARSS
jgi:hypothetical protein